MSTPITRPPLPPFTLETAKLKARLAEDGWNSRDPEKVSLSYAVDSVWRNRAEFPTGRAEIVQFLSRKWKRELDYRLIKELWAFHENGLPCALHTSGVTTAATGIALTEMRIGNLTLTVSWLAALPASTTCRSRNPNGSSFGPWALVLTTTPGFLIWDFEQLPDSPFMITLHLEIKVKPGGREGFLDAIGVLFDQLSQERSFVDAWVHTTDEDPDLIVVYERWKETQESFVRDILPKPFFKPYLAAFEKLGGERRVRWLETHIAWRS